MKVTLTVQDRITLPGIMPASTSLDGMARLRDINNAIEFSKKEIDRIKLVSQPSMIKPGALSYKWDEKKAKDITIELDLKQIELLQNNINKLSAENKITSDIYNICLKINGLK